MTILLAFSLWGQQGGQGGGPGVAELIQALVVLLFVFGPAILQLLFGKKKEPVKKGPQAAPPVGTASHPATPVPIHQEIDDFIRNRSEHIERTEQRPERGERNRPPRHNKRPRPSRVPTPTDDVVVPAARSLTAIAAEATTTTLLSSERSTAQHHGSGLMPHPIAAMLHSPNSLAHAVVLSEILRRPNF